jgi:hypothetical protein
MPMANVMMQTETPMMYQFSIAAGVPGHGRRVTGAALRRPVVILR